MNAKGSIAHWPLDGTTNDVVGANHGAGQHVEFGEGPRGEPQGAAIFPKEESAIVVPDAESLRLGNGDFAISLWARCPSPMRSVFGDLLSKFDENTRCGVNLYVAGSSPGYNAMSDTRHVHLGIDDGHVGDWIDCGKPWPSNSLITNLLAMDGHLYAGIADAADPMDACRVFRWGGGQNWVNCGRLGDEPRHLSVQGMIVHQGALYAAAGVWDWIKAHHQVPGFQPADSHVFRYEGGQTWRDLGQVGQGSGRIFCMASLDGKLYVGIDNMGGGKCFMYDGAGWIDCGGPDGRNFENLQPLDGVLYGATHGRIYRYQGGQTWECIGDEPYGITQIHSLQVYRGKLYVGSWPQGYVLRYEGGVDWTITGRLGIPAGLAEINEVNDLTVHNGKLYAGVIPKAQVYRYESDGHWTLLRSLGSRPGWAEADSPTWCRVPTLTTFQGRLFAGTGSCISRTGDVDPDGTLGRVYALQAGQMASHESDIGDGWTHLAAVRRGKALLLYVNGELSAHSVAPAGQTLDLTNTQPLIIGSGPQSHFSGAIADVRLYDRALATGGVEELAAGRG